MRDDGQAEEVHRGGDRARQRKAIRPLTSTTKLLGGPSESSSLPWPRACRWRGAIVMMHATETAPGVGTVVFFVSPAGAGRNQLHRNGFDENMVQVDVMDKPMDP